MKKGKLYLIPVPLDPDLNITAIPEHTRELAANLKEFIVERERTARHVLKAYGLLCQQDEVILHDIGKHSDESLYPRYLDSCEKGLDIGLMSESGCPGVADPGAKLVRIAQEKAIEIVPLTGPSAILLALMASGMNGQNFAFRGYLPMDKHEKSQVLKDFRILIKQHKQTQILIETPFRVQQCLDELSSKLDGDIRICLALNIGTSQQEFITKSASQWRGVQLKHKKPLAVFVVGV